MRIRVIVAVKLRAHRGNESSDGLLRGFLTQSQQLGVNDRKRRRDRGLGEIRMQWAFGDGFEYLAEVVFGKLVEGSRKQRGRVNFPREVNDGLTTAIDFSENDGRSCQRGDARLEMDIGVH